MHPLNIVFMGTPDFAVPSLAKLLEAGHQVSAVVTAPDKPKGRGKQLSMSAVKNFAIGQELPVLQPEKLRDPAFLEALSATKANLFVVVAFRMLPEAVWAMPVLGTINLHGSLLPQYRGAAPINWAIINGEAETGLTTFFIQHDIDTGDILFQESLPIASSDTASSLHDRMMALGADLVLKTVDAIAAGNAEPQPQASADELKPAPKIHREDCQIHWTKSAEDVHNFVRGLSPYPGAWTQLNMSQYKILETKLQLESGLWPGQVATDNKTHLTVGCNDGAVQIIRLQKQGKKAMHITEFFNGNTL